MNTCRPKAVHLLVGKAQRRKKNVHAEPSVPIVLMALINWVVNKLLIIRQQIADLITCKSDFSRPGGNCEFFSYDSSVGTAT